MEETMMGRRAGAAVVTVLLSTIIFYSIASPLQLFSLENSSFFVSSLEQLFCYLQQMLHTD